MKVEGKLIEHWAQFEMVGMLRQNGRHSRLRCERADCPYPIGSSAPRQFCSDDVTGG